MTCKSSRLFESALLITVYPRMRGSSSTSFKNLSRFDLNFLVPHPDMFRMLLGKQLNNRAPCTSRHDSLIINLLSLECISELLSFIFQLSLITHYWTWMTHFVTWGSCLFYFVFILILCAFLWPWLVLHISDLVSLRYLFVPCVWALHEVT